MRDVFCTEGVDGIDIELQNPRVSAFCDDLQAGHFYSVVDKL